MLLVDLDLNQYTSELEVHRKLAEEMHFPEYYGNNLDALYDILTDGLDANYCVRLTPCRDKNAPLYAFEQKLRKVLYDAAETVDEQDGAMYAVFADKTQETNPWDATGRSW